MAEEKTCEYCQHSTYDDEKWFKKWYCSKLAEYKYNTDCCNHWELKHYLEARRTAGDGNSSSSSCFLTSACVDFYGKPDDCEELTKLRQFRDIYMKGTEEGKKLVEEYYRVGPLIVDAINCADCSALYYEEIYGIIKKCVALIDAGEMEKALEEYLAMVNSFKKRFNID